MKKIYLISFIVMIEALILGFSSAQEKYIIQKKPTEKIVFETAPKKPIEKEIPIRKIEKLRIECPKRITLISKIDHTFYRTTHFIDSHYITLKLNVYNNILAIPYRRFTKLPDEVLNAECIKKMDIRESFLTTFPVQLLKQPDLKELNLSHNRISICPNVETPTSLFHLNLAYNRMTEFPNIEAFKSVVHLNLSHNQITTFPDIETFGSIANLNLSHNQITTFPNIKATTSITSLNLSGNQIKEIPSNILFFTQLEYLHLENMESLESIHDNIKHLKHLKHLVIQRTPIARSYSKITKLRQLLPNTYIFWDKNQKVNYQN